MTANLHAIWLDDLAPGEGATTPIWDETFAATDDETRVYLRALMTSGPVEPVATSPRTSQAILDANLKAFKDEIERPLFTDPSVVAAVRMLKDGAPKRKKPAKKSTPRKKPGVLADAEAKLAGVAARVKAQTDELGGNDAGEVNELAVAFACLLGLLLAPVLIAVFSR